MISVKKYEIEMHWIKIPNSLHQLENKFPNKSLIISGCLDTICLHIDTNSDFAQIVTKQGIDMQKLKNNCIDNLFSMHHQVIK